MKYLVDETTLTGIAAAIRSKTGNTEQITAAEMAAQIESIETGGNTDIPDAIINRNITEYSSSSLNEVGWYSFVQCYSLTTVDFPNATGIYGYAFKDCWALSDVNIPKCTIILQDAFYKCKRLTAVNFPLVTNIQDYAFYQCEKLITINFPKCTSIGNYGFYFCYKLATADFPSLTSIGSMTFNNCGALTTLILRNESNVCTLSSTNTFQSTPIASGTGYVYVPDALLANYKAATNWSTYADQIKPLSELPEV